MTPPKVFVSHASEDKERFVLGFAERLRQGGVDAWLDLWEMGPGDSLIDKIFDEGIKESDAFIIVLSAHSIEKPWVKQELDVACVNRINKGSKLIPVVLDNCEVPQVLTSTIWEAIKNTDSYDAEFGRILDSIFGTVRKPPLGKPSAAYAGFHSVSSVKGVDAFVYKEVCAEALRNESYRVSLKKIFLEEGNPQISSEELYESVEYLTGYGLFEPHKELSTKPDKVVITGSGFELFARENVPDLKDAYNTIGLAVLNGSVSNLFEAKKSCGFGELLTEHVFRSLATGGHIKTAELINGDISVLSIFPTLRRTLVEEN